MRPCGEVCDGHPRAIPVRAAVRRDARSSEQSARNALATLRKLLVAANRKHVARSVAGVRHPTHTQAPSKLHRKDNEQTTKAHRTRNESASNFVDNRRQLRSIRDNG